MKVDNFRFLGVSIRKALLTLLLIYKVPRERCVFLKHYMENSLNDFFHESQKSNHYPQLRVHYSNVGISSSSSSQNTFILLIYME